MTVFKIKLNKFNKLDNNLFKFLMNNKSLELDLIDKIQENYITIQYGNKNIDIPFNYFIINTNKKLKGIPYINFELNCSCKKLGLCNLSKYCYSLRDQKRFKANNYKIYLNVLFFELVQNNSELKEKIFNYLSNYKLIRFNCNNDLNNLDNYKFLIELANYCTKSIIYGYTKRIDLIQQIKQLDKPNNLILNSSINNLMLDNIYKTTSDLKEYLNTNYYCLGSCKNCLKCCIDNKTTIYCLLHGSLNTIDPIFNTSNNRQYLIEFFKTELKIELTEDNLKQNKGLLYSLNKTLKQQQIDLKFKNYPQLIEYIKTIKGSVKYE